MWCCASAEAQSCRPNPSQSLRARTEREREKKKAAIFKCYNLNALFKPYDTMPDD